MHTRRGEEGPRGDGAGLLSHRTLISRRITGVFLGDRLIPGRKRVPLLFTDILRADGKVAVFPISLPEVALSPVALAHVAVTRTGRRQEE